MTQSYERQPSADPSMYQDVDASFSQTRVDEILKSEGFLSPDSGISHMTSSDSSSNALDDDFFKGHVLTKYCTKHSPRENQTVTFNISASKINPQGKPIKTHKSTAYAKESLAILQSRKKLPVITKPPASRDKPD